jgi:putative peptidoglycan lipid II flippase
VAAGILFSRIAGLARQVVTAAFLGTSDIASVFTMALRMPNVLQNLLGEGTLSASFIPVYAKLLEEGREEEAGRVAGAIFAFLFAIAGALALGGILLAPLLVRLLAPGYTDRPELFSLTVTAVRIIFPMTGVLVLSAWALGILNSRRRFFISYVAPVFWNIAIIGALIAFGGRLSAEGLVKALAWGALVGGVLQFAVQLPWVFALERKLRVGWHARVAEVRAVVKQAGPAILGRGSVQLSGWIDLVLISFLWDGAAAVLGYAQTFYLLPISLFGMSVAAAELPELSRLYGNSGEVLQRRLNTGLRQIAFLIIPSFVAYLALGDVIVAGLLQWRNFTADDTVIVYVTLAAFSVGLIPSTASRLFSSSFFALRDTRTPAWFALVRVGLTALLGGGLMVLCERFVIAGRPLGVMGLALGGGIASWVEWALLRRALRARIGPVRAGAAPLVRMFAAAVLAALVARGAGLLLPSLPPLISVVLVPPLFGITYLATTHLLGLEETAGVLGRFGRRLRG